MHTITYKNGLTVRSSLFNVRRSLTSEPSLSSSSSICFSYALMHNSLISALLHEDTFFKLGHLSLLRKSIICPKESTYHIMKINLHRYSIMY